MRGGRRPQVNFKDLEVDYKDLEAGIKPYSWSNEFLSYEVDDATGKPSLLHPSL